MNYWAEGNAWERGDESCKLWSSQNSGAYVVQPKSKTQFSPVGEEEPSVQEWGLSQHLELDVSDEFSGAEVALQCPYWSGLSHEHIWATSLYY